MSRPKASISVDPKLHPPDHRLLPPKPGRSGPRPLHLGNVGASIVTEFGLQVSGGREGSEGGREGDGGRGEGNGLREGGRWMDGWRGEGERDWMGRERITFSVI